MTFDRDDDGWTNYNFPEENTIQDVIDGLEDEDNWIDTLTCDFNDENFSTTQRLREAIMSRRDANVCEIEIFSSCVNQENRERSLDFFLRYLDDNDLHPNPTYCFAYQTVNSWTLAQAQKSASVIASLRSDIKGLSLLGNLFDEEGTFECIFGAVLDGGVIKRFSVMAAKTITDLKRGCIGRSNLANNTTLEVLDLDLFDPSAGHKIDETMEHLANALKSNRRLDTISIAGAMMTNVGRRLLMESLRDNATIVQLRTRDFDVINPNDEEGIQDIQMESRVEREDGQLLQSQIDRHTKLNRFWKRYASRKCNGRAQLNQFWNSYAIGNHNDCGSDGDHKEECVEEYDSEEKERLNSIPERTLSLDIYPDVLEVLAKKPLLLFMFLREEHPQLFRSFDRRPVPRQRRRSERLLKKRRITAPGSVF